MDKSALRDERSFGPNWPVPSTPVGEACFDSRRYWRGPTWVNVNWMLADGFARHGDRDTAAWLIDRTLQLVDRSGFCEY
jgi:hypothetical protein